VKSGQQSQITNDGTTADFGTIPDKGKIAELSRHKEATVAELKRKFNEDLGRQAGVLAEIEAEINMNVVSNGGKGYLRDDLLDAISGPFKTFILDPINLKLSLSQDHWKEQAERADQLAEQLQQMHETHL